MIATAGAPYLSRPGPNLAAGLLALGVHVVFVLLLVVGVSWQTQHPAPVMVDLWTALPETPRPPAPPVEPPPPPKPAAPERPPVEKPVVKETPPPRPPDIALEKEKARKKAEAEKLEKDRKKAEAERLEKLKAMQAAEEKALADAAREEAAAMKKAQEKQLADKERKRRELLRQMEEEELMARMADEEARQSAAARAASARRQTEIDRIKSQYQDMIGATVRGNTRLPPDLKGNPEVRFLVRLLPTGEVVDVRRTQSSGNAAYDEAVERAIRKSSPLPLPADRDVRAAFVPELSFVHRPKE